MLTEAKTTDQTIDPAKASELVRPAASRIAELAVRALRGARRTCELAEQDVKNATVTAYEAIQAAGLRSVTFLLQDGVQLQATLSDPTQREFDVSKVPADLVETVTKRVVDTKKWDAAVQLGLVSDEVLAAVVTKKAQPGRVTLTERAVERDQVQAGA
jgi:sulfur relay (sulfurtransferase) complex TusBCD TusD component (DsrE family)